MNKQQILLDQMRKQAGLINKAKFEGKSQLPFRKEFAKLQRQHKAIWLREYKKSL